MVALLPTICLAPQTAVHDQPLVRVVHVVAHTLTFGAAEPNTSDNQWSTYLLLADSTSVRLKMRAEPGRVTAELSLTSQNYQMTNSGIPHFDFATQGLYESVTLFVWSIKTANVSTKCRVEDLVAATGCE